jgi:hypothetical protein
MRNEKRKITARDLFELEGGLIARPLDPRRIRRGSVVQLERGKGTGYDPALLG